MNRFILYTLCLLLFIGCTNEKKESYDYHIILNNEQLKKEIDNYREYICKQINTNDSIYIEVDIMNLGDSLDKVMLSPIYDEFSFMGYASVFAKSFE